MSRNKDQDVKDFLISERKKIGSGLTTAPTWLMQKAGERLWNNRQKRTWKNIDMTARHRKNKRGQAKTVIKSGDHKKSKKGDQ
ncbi:MAG: hypothetical protein PHQ98_00265 [Candidatus ainarchaeum sp.]|nr:hypothetical protein [Candidatus ainarchaeum sp.]